MLPPIFQRPLSDLSRVGSKISSLLKRLDLHTQAELLMYFPVRYDDFRSNVALDSAPLNTPVTVTGVITIIGTKKSFKKRMALTEALIEDGSSSLRVVWYKQPYLSRTLKIGDTVSLSGKVIKDRYGVYMSSPQYEKVFQNANTVHTGRLVPMYALTQNVTQKQIRLLVQQVLKLQSYIPEWLPENILKQNNLIGFGEALKNIHFPENNTLLEKARNRLQFDELFTLQIGVLQHQKLLQKEPAIPIPFFEQEIKQFTKNLPFLLTDDQKKSAWSIVQDMKRSLPMNRLLQGDVGSGKTVVAALASYNCVLSHHQVALMSPTEILAQQTFAAFQKLLPPTVKISLLTGSIKHDITHADIVIGTHALIEEGVKFSSLALVIIDEQHRFGVKQRKALRDKSGDPTTIPHLLSMTATPIPRSLMLTVYGDLEVSQIRQKPSNRKPIITQVFLPEKRSLAYEKVRLEIQNGRQAMVVCPLIEESDVLGVTSVSQEYEKIQKVFPDFHITMLHGKMRPAEKEKIMKDFRDNKIHILVSTSVIEVGVDFPNATVMFIEGAERFGLSQLHQFRGRVGRSDYQSYCFLFQSEEQKYITKRLHIMTQTQDGFVLAEHDLQLRGSGTTYGVQQSGFASDLRIARITDIPLLQTARKTASDLLSQDPELKKHPSVAQEMNAWQSVFHLE